MATSVDALEIVPAASPASAALEDVVFPHDEDAQGIPSAVQRLKDTIGHSAQRVQARLRAQAILTLRQDYGYGWQKIAQVLEMKPNAVRVALYRARKAGALNDLRDLLEYDVSANAIDTVNRAIVKDRNVKVALKHLQGLGHYRNYSHAKHEGAAGAVLPPLQVNVVFAGGHTPAGPGLLPEPSEAVVGCPREDAL